LSDAQRGPRAEGRSAEGEVRCAGRLYNPLFSDLERLVIRYAEEMTEKVQVESRLVEELKQQLGPEALVQLTLSIAAANFTNRFNEALGTELET